MFIITSVFGSIFGEIIDPNRLCVNKSTIFTTKLQMVLVGILGRKRVGKDTMADHMVEHHGFHKVTLAGPLKEACRAIFGFTDEQLYGETKEVDDSHWKVSPRKALQFMGTDIVRNKLHELIPWIGNRFWLERFKVEYHRLQQTYGPDVRVVVSDLRFQNEIQFLKEMGGIVVRVQRLGLDEGDQHESERLIDDITGEDHIVQNNGTVETYLENVDMIVKDVTTGYKYVEPIIPPSKTP